MTQEGAKTAEFLVDIDLSSNMILVLNHHFGDPAFPDWQLMFVERDEPDSFQILRTVQVSDRQARTLIGLKHAGHKFWETK